MKKLLIVLVLGNLVATDAFAEELKFCFVGDILLAGQAGHLIDRYGPKYPFLKVKPIFKQADVKAGNLECALTGNDITRNVRLSGRRWFCFKTPPRMGRALKEAGFTIVSLANNHSLNGGTKGLVETITTLDKIGILWVGAGRNFQEATAARILEIKGKKIAFLAYNDVGGSAATKTRPGLALLGRNTSAVMESVRTAKKKADLLIVMFHWGIEGSTRPSIRQQIIAKQVIDVGADIVIGSHPHVLQPVAIYHGKTIAYSLGNFIFDNPRPACSRTDILKVTVRDDGKQNVQLIPCYIRRCQPAPIFEKRH